MTKINNEMHDKYVEYIKLLESLCKCYDQGNNDVIALSISTAIRTLIHDTPSSTSLLKYLGKKDIPFVSTNYFDDRYKVHLGLVRRLFVGVEDGIGGEVKYWPHCDGRHFTPYDNLDIINQKDWWETEIIFDSGESKLTRKDLVLAIANKDGGAHYDKRVQKKYDDFRHSWSGKHNLIGTQSGTIRGFDNIPTYAGIRQIGYEILKTLEFEG